MKTLLVSRRFAPTSCGVGDYTRELARFLSGRGETVCVLTEPVQGERPAGVRVIETPLRGWRDFASVLRTLEGESPELVQLEYSQYGWHRWGCAFWLNALFLVLRLKGVRLHLALHEFPIHFSRHPWRFMLAAVQRVHFWLLCLTAHQVMTNTRERVGILRKWLPWRAASCQYRPNSNCNPVYPLFPSGREALRMKAGAPEEEIVVGVYGLFAEAKNLESVVQAMSALREEFPLHLWLLGDPRQASPRYVRKLQNLAEPLKGRVSWLGPLSPEDVSFHLQAVDIFVLPQPDGHLTRSGSFMAAAAHGLPVIAVRNDRNQHEFTHGKDAWLIEKSSSEEIAKAIAALVKQPELRLHLGAQLHRLYAAVFDWPTLHGISDSPAKNEGSAGFATGPSRAA